MLGLPIIKGQTRQPKSEPYVPWTDRVRRVRDKAYARRHALTNWIRICAAILLPLMLSMLLEVIYSGLSLFFELPYSLFSPRLIGRAGPLAVILVIEWLFLLVAGSVALVELVRLLFRVGKTWDRIYAETWSGFVHSGLGKVLVEEEYWKPFYSVPSQRIFVSYKFPVLSSKLEDHIDFGAAFQRALLEAAAGPGRVMRFSVMRGFQAIQQIKARKQLPWMFIPLILFLLFQLALIGYTSFFASLPVLAMMFIMPMVITATMGPQLLSLRAQKAAICDFLLDEPQIELDQLERLEPCVPKLERWWTDVYEWLNRRKPPLY